VLFVPTMLRGAGQATLLPADAALGSVDLILAAAIQSGDVCRRGGGIMDGSAKCDCLHAGSDQRPTLCDMRG
jgi:hypothetical protein